MLSLSELHRHLFNFMKLAEMDDIKIEVSYSGRVYLLTVEPTGREYKVPRTFKHSKKDAVKLSKALTCKLCGMLFISGICTNKACELGAT